MDYGEIGKEALNQGWRVDRRKGKDLWFSPDGQTIVTWHLTPSDRRRALRNFLSRVKRGGLQWPPPRRKKGS